MTDYKNSKWALEIIELQREDGSWGYFHTLSNPSKRYPITTEQAIRRLEILGYTIDDEPILKAVSYMHDCLVGRSVPIEGRSFMTGTYSLHLCWRRGSEIYERRSGCQ